MSRYSFSGTGNIILKATTEGKYGNKKYLKNEPIAYFTEVGIDVSFSSVESVARAGVKNLAANSESSPSILNIDGVAVNETLQSLLYKKQTNLNRLKTEVKSISSLFNEAYLPITNSQELQDDVFVYDKDKNIITNLTIDLQTGLITGLPDGSYTVFYKVKEDAKASYYLSENNMPYLAAEIQISGNIGGKNGVAIVYLDKLKLLSDPELNFLAEDPFVSSLRLAIMTKYDEVEINYYGR